MANTSWAVAAHDIAKLVENKGLSIAAAADEVIQKKIKPAGRRRRGDRADAKGGNISSFNTEGLVSRSAMSRPTANGTWRFMSSRP